MAHAEHIKWNEVLTNTKVEDVIIEDAEFPFIHKKKNINPDNFSVAFVERSDTVSDTIKLLISKHISSAPVYDARLNKFIGFIDMLDLIGYSLAKFYVDNSKLTDKDAQRGAEEFLASKIESLINFSGRNAWRTVTQSCSILTAINLLSDHDVHRVAVTNDEKKKVVAILTQSRIIKWLNDRSSKSDLPKDLGMLKVKDWSVFVLKNQVQTISKHETVLDAFRKMYECQISGLPIVNKKGKLIGTITASDLKLILKDPAEFFSNLLIKRMSMTLHTFIEWKSTAPRFSEKDVAIGCARIGPSTCAKEDTFVTVLERLQTRGFHRVWIVDDESKPTGVISLCDLLKECYEHYVVTSAKK